MQVKSHNVRRFCVFLAGVVLAGSLGATATATPQIAHAGTGATAPVAEAAAWILTSDEEAKALSAGNDSVMDKYYDEETGDLKPGRTTRGSVEANPNGCVLTLANVHWRESSGYTKIGFKPTTKCDTKPIGISYTNELEKHMVLGVWKSEWKGLYVLTAANLTATTSKKGYIYQDINKKCDNTLSTDWRGKTSSTMKATNGSTYYARQYSPGIFTAKCGT